MKPLGQTQLAVIDALQRHGGHWRDGCGWQWDTPSGTRKIMEGLLKRGVVTCEDEEIKGKYRSWTVRTYRLTQSDQRTA
jgi:hypothetical protein